MTPTNEQIMAEVRRRTTAVWGKELEDTIIEVMREGWTPPEPEPVDPDVLAFREWSDGHFRLGDFDGNLMATAFLAGARMARIKEHERAWVLVWALENIADADQDEISDIALNALAKYRGEA